MCRFLTSVEEDPIDLAVDDVDHFFADGEGLEGAVGDFFAGLSGAKADELLSQAEDFGCERFDLVQDAAGTERLFQANGAVRVASRKRALKRPCARRALRKKTQVGMANCGSPMVRAWIQVANDLAP